MINLNPALPFIKSVSALVSVKDEAGKEYEDCLAAAAGELARIEQRHNVYFIPYLNTRANCIVPNERPGKLVIGKLISSLKELADSNALESHYHAGSVKNDAEGFLIFEDGLAEKHLFPFLSESELILQGMDFGYSVVFPGGEVACWSLRGWGSVLANWANATRWHLKERDGKPWSYTDFYMYLDSQIVSYAAFSKCFSKIIGKKIQQQSNLT